MASTNTEKKQPVRIECINPILNVKSLPVSREYYVKVLGFNEADWGDNNFTFMQRDNSGIYLCQKSQGSPGTWVWIGFDGNMAVLYGELKEKGAIILEPPTYYSYALEMKVEDPDGHVLRFGTDPKQEEP
jgi:catechol 2,3-dioxygenase-like lactoylglutathione lyase family enzyme